MVLVTLKTRGHCVESLAQQSEFIPRAHSGANGKIPALDGPSNLGEFEHRTGKGSGDSRADHGGQDEKADGHQQ